MNIPDSKKKYNTHRSFLSFLSFLFISVSFLCCLFILLLRFGIITYSSTPSIGYGFFYVKKNAEIKTGDYVIFKNPRTDLLETTYLLKRVEEIKDGYCILKGKTTTQLFDATGKSNLYSFDSDFFGPVKLSDCTKVVPLSFINRFLN